MKKKQNAKAKPKNELLIESNKYEDNLTIDPHEWFVKQKILPVQKDLNEYFDKIIKTK